MQLRYHHGSVPVPETSVLPSGEEHVCQMGVYEFYLSAASEQLLDVNHTLQEGNNTQKKAVNLLVIGEDISHHILQGSQ